MAKFDTVKDSGDHQDFDSGSVRDTREGKGRFDLVPELAMVRLAKHFQNGANKYKERNWELGQPLSRYWDSARRHWGKVMLGLDDEDHEAAALWNICCFIETRERINLGVLPAELDDMPKTFADKDVMAKLINMLEL